MTRGQIFDQLLGGGLDDADLVDEPAHMSRARRFVERRSAISARSRDTERDSSSLRPGASPSQNGIVGAMPRRVLDAHDAALDAPNAIGGVAELEDVAGHAFDREILVDRADDLIFGFEQYLIVGIVGDRPARGQRGQPRAAPAAQHMIDRVVVDESAAPPAAGGEAVGQHCHHCGKILARQLPVGPGAADQRVKLVLAPFPGRDLGDDLLGQHIERLVGDAQPIELAAAHTVDQRRAFDQFVAR